VLNKVEIIYMEVKSLQPSVYLDLVLALLSSYDVKLLSLEGYEIIPICRDIII
jgi:hypothetical protein